MKKKTTSAKRSWKGWVVVTEKGQVVAFERTKANAQAWLNDKRLTKRATLVEDE